MSKRPKYELIKDFPVEKLKPYDRNPRKNEQAVTAMAESIKEFGFVSPIIIDSGSRICAGHTRLKAALSLGLKTVPVLRVSTLTGNRFAGYNIADNKIGEIAGWDDEELAAILKELSEDDFNMDALGFDDAELAEYLADGGIEGKTDPDAVPDPPKKPVCKTGDLWQLGKHRLLCGDATKEADVERLMGGG